MNFHLSQLYSVVLQNMLTFHYVSFGDFGKTHHRGGLKRTCFLPKFLCLKVDVWLCAVANSRRLTRSSDTLTGMSCWHERWNLLLNPYWYVLRVLWDTPCVPFRKVLTWNLKKLSLLQTGVLLIPGALVTCSHLGCWFSDSLLSNWDGRSTTWSTRCRHSDLFLPENWCCIRIKSLFKSPHNMKCQMSWACCFALLLCGHSIHLSLKQDLRFSCEVAAKIS